MTKILSITGAALLFFLGSVQAGFRPCAGHGGPVGRAEGGLYRCEDGTIDRGPRRSKKKNPRTTVLRFRSHTERGQVLNPGEQPPTISWAEANRPR